MIGNNYIGNLGRLGNQMFQYAALRGIAAKHGYEYFLPHDDFVGKMDPNCERSDYSIFNCFDLPEAPRMLLDIPNLEEKCFELDAEIWNNCPDNVSLYGYFQTERYFKHIEDEIRSSFTFKEEIMDHVIKNFTDMFDNTSVISLHIRRTDYLKYTHHPILNMEYYQTALNELPDLPVLVFSDDIDWCKEQDFLSGDRFYHSEENSTAVDLCLQSLCSYHIIANSSYSWWGAYLANSKTVYAPKNWFGPPLTHNTKDLYPEGWKIC
jgi:hypothetical protein